jgi:hypothetical protein
MGTAGLLSAAISRLIVIIDKVKKTILLSIILVFYYYHLPYKITAKQ